MTHKEIQSAIVELLNAMLEKNQAIDITKDQEIQLGVTRDDFNAAVRTITSKKGYSVIMAGPVCTVRTRILFRAADAKKSFPKIHKIGAMDIRKFRSIMKRMESEKK